MKILGIDPGLAKTGYAIIECENGRRAKLRRSGLIKTTPKQETHDRLAKIYEAVYDLMEIGIQEVVIEEAVFARGIIAGIKLGQSRGVIMLAVSQLQLPLAQYAPTTIKKIVAGKGNRGKDIVQEAVRRHLKLKSTMQEDEADAAATALCHLASEHGYVFTP